MLVVREESLDLYGFASPAERTLFEAFTSVNGVGPRLGLAICGVADPDELRLAIARGDSARLQAASGVGKRTAERIVLELRDRLGALNGSAAAPTPAPPTSTCPRGTAWSRSASGPRRPTPPSPTRRPASTPRA